MKTRNAETADIRLPAPKTEGMSLSDALSRRRSHREFATRQLSLEQVSQLCWVAQGITSDEEYRAAPSAGALFPITLFVLDSGGVFEYLPRSHTLRRHLDGDLRGQLQGAAWDQTCVGTAPVCMIISIDIKRTASKYGHRAEQYCLLEVGHVAQNILLAATAIGLSGVPVGAFEEQKATALLNLPPHLQLVYLLPVGYRRDE